MQPASAGDASWWERRRTAIGRSLTVICVMGTLATSAACGHSTSSVAEAVTASPASATPPTTAGAMLGWFAAHGGEFAAVQDALSPLEDTSDFGLALSGCSGLEKQLVGLEASVLPTPDELSTTQLKGALDEFLQASRECQDASRRQDRAAIAHVNDEIGIASQHLTVAGTRMRRLAGLN